MIAKLLACRFTIKFPSDLDPISVHSAVPCPGLCREDLQAGDSALPQTLTRKHPDFDLRLIQPTAVDGRVMDREPIPDFRRHFRAKDVRQSFAAMNVQVIQYQMDGLRVRVC